MEVVISQTAEQAGVLVADVIEARLGAGGDRVVTLGLATGSSPEPAYTELIRRHREEGLSFAGARGFLLDEYLGLGPEHPQSYHAVIRRVYADDVDLTDVDGPDGLVADVPAEARAYEQRIAAAGGIDVQLLGIGTDGHVGFNEPGSSLRSRTRVKTLTAQTRADNARFFDSADQVPRHVLTQGLGTILEARHLVLIATGAGKADAVAAAVEGPLSASCPASVLQWHPHATVVLDDAAAASLQRAGYYREAYANKPAWQGL